VVESAKILVVEDDPQLRRMYRMSLTVAGFDVREASDGIEALRRVEDESPDLVILDLALPRLQGRDVQLELTANARTRHIPIVIVTGDPGDLVESENVCILRKPIDPEKLIQTVQRCLRKHG
jgi:DNA-binding response OmpR family regulator